MVWPLPPLAERPLRLGTSLCLLGAPVRYNGQPKECRAITRQLNEPVEFIAVCPEMGIGLGVPRPTLRIVMTDQDEDRLVEGDSGRDHTATMQAWARAKAEELAGENLHGFVLAKGSPSCGMERVKVYKNGGPSHRSREGFFVEALRARLPWLPLEEDGRLNDPHLHAHFFGRVRAIRRLRLLFEGPWKRGEVVEFHAREKFFLLAHGTAGYAALGKLVGAIAELPAEDFAARYQALFLETIAQRPSRGRHQNVLDHIAGFFKHPLRAAEKQELREAIASYRRGEASLAMPARLLRFLATAYQEDYLLQQTYLDEALRA